MSQSRLSAVSTSSSLHLTMVSFTSPPIARCDIDAARSQTPRTLYERLEILPDLNDDTDGMRRMAENFMIHDVMIWEAVSAT
jgi:hypothetical protein